MRRRRAHTEATRGAGLKGRSLRAPRGFTLIELQVAIVLLVIAAFILGGHHHVYNQLLSGVHEDRRAAGYVDLTAERAFLMIAEEGPGAGPPPCDIKVNSVSFSGTYPRVFARVQQAQ
jgi:prepilin-type N-terminal cleavage/methylation domain-containing protein